MNENNIDYLAGLNPAQREAVENYEGATLIIAGAGSGKTRVLTMRIAYMLQKGVKPYNILALTFTNKAAREMKERINAILPYSAIRGMQMGTFHSVFCRILRAEAPLLGFPEAFTIYDTADARNVIKAIVKEMELPDDKYKPNEVYSRISLAKNNLILPDAYTANQQLTEEDSHSKRPQVHEIYRRYVARCRQSGAMDFDDLLLYMNVLLRDHPAVVEKYGNLFRYILVDEYQDTNFSQYLIVKKLASIYRNICVVGDDSQSIYSFRGARIENILRFQKDNPDCRIFKLEQNYRSTSTIVNAANSLIDKNTRKLPKKLFSTNEAGDKIKVIMAQSDKEEGQRVASDIHTTMYSVQVPANDFAVMYRTNAQSRVIEEYLRSKGIPYRIYGGHSFFQRAEVKDMISYLRLAVNPRDDEALKRVINFPPRGIGETSIQKVELAARANNVSMWDVLSTQTPAEIGVRGPAVKSLGGFMAIFKEISERCNGVDAYALASEVAERSGVIQHYRMSRAVEDESRLQNTEELLKSIKEFVEAELPEGEEQQVNDKSISAWLQDVSLLTDMDSNTEDNTPRVTLMTVHASKGLEFKYTYIVGLEENLFPSSRGVETLDNIEEERRLFYVALTRAERRVVLSFATSRFKWGNVTPSNPSRFIKEIDPQYVELPEMMDYMCGDRDDDDDVVSSYKPKQQSYSRQWQQRAASSSTSSSQRQEPSIVREEPPVGFRKVTTGSGTVVASASQNLVEGAKVQHARFGVGRIVGLERTVDDTRVTVDFGAGGEKVLLAKYAKLTVVE